MSNHDRWKKAQKTMEYTNDMIMKKLEELEGHISEIKDDNKNLSAKLSDIKNESIEKLA